jgi:ABC-type transporter Mla subunit MlaD
MTEENEVLQLQKAIEILNEYRKTLTTSVSEMGNTVTALDSRIRKIESNGNMKQEIDVLNERMNNVTEVTKQRLEKADESLRDLATKLNANEQKDNQIIQTLEEQSKMVSEAVSFKNAVRNFVKELVK